jgi:hypothetical protein
MPYSSFTLDDVEEKFGLDFKASSFIPTLEPIFPSDWLKETLLMTLPLAKIAGSEKARSEFIIAPILVELIKLTNNEISVFSGEDFTVDRELGLNGICDFIISQSSNQIKVSAPVIALVEAKKGVLKDGWGQSATQGSEETSEQSVAACIAKMLAANKFNEHRKKSIEYMYGIVTSGNSWQFLRMKEKTVIIDPDEYTIASIEKLLAILNWMVSDRECR